MIFALQLVFLFFLAASAKPMASEDALTETATQLKPSEDLVQVAEVKNSEPIKINLPGHLLFSYYKADMPVDSVKRESKPNRPKENEVDSDEMATEPPLSESEEAVVYNTDWEHDKFAWYPTIVEVEGKDGQKTFQFKPNRMPAGFYAAKYRRRHQ
ncbi:unnamed protein product [Bursaphelenchus xylophilus]|uniref:(pine wood nematode) hypothetical protein n=1 Tax=Bursaphelenchus xylophilus TaxID=6326 RepID=A0A1I7S8D8_BURXY|nr:unnamed protein product [Bursaphelenchus xylophilus]CAG9120995.1 unnamed protein product [Bursaphelenchus xylophilus]